MRIAAQDRPAGSAGQKERVGAPRRRVAVQGRRVGSAAWRKAGLKFVEEESMRRLGAALIGQAGGAPIGWARTALVEWALRPWSGGCVRPLAEWEGVGVLE